MEMAMTRSSSTSQMTAHLSMSAESRSSEPASSLALAPQPLAVQTIQANSRNSTTSFFNAPYAHKLGWSQIACGVLCIMLGIVALIIRCQVAWLGSPLWSGLAFFLVAGIFGVAAGPNDTCTIIAFLVMSVMSAIVAFVMMIAMLVAASSEYAFCHHSCNSFYCTTVCSGQAGRIAVDVLVAIIGLVEVVIAIISSSISCRRSPATISTQTMVQHFFPSSSGQVTIYTAGHNGSVMNEQHYIHVPSHLYNQPSTYPITLPGTIISTPQETISHLQAGQTQPLTHGAGNPPRQRVPPLPLGIQPLTAGSSDSSPQGVALPPYSMLSSSSSADSTPQSNGTGSLLVGTPPSDVALTPDGGTVYPFGVPMYPSLPPPYHAERSFHPQ